MTSTIRPVMDPTSWTGTSSCGPGRLAGDADGWRLGLAVLQQRGVAAWLRVRQATVPDGRPAHARPGRRRPVAGGVDAELVGLLAVDGAGRRRAGVSGR